MSATRAFLASSRLMVVPRRGKALANWARPSIDELGVPTEPWKQVTSFFRNKFSLIVQWLKWLSRSYLPVTFLLGYNLFNYVCRTKILWLIVFRFMTRTSPSSWSTFLLEPLPLVFPCLHSHSQSSWTQPLNICWRTKTFRNQNIMCRPCSNYTGVDKSYINIVLV